MYALVESNCVHFISTINAKERESDKALLGAFIFCKLSECTASPDQ